MEIFINPLTTLRDMDQDENKYEKIPHGGDRFEEDGLLVFWNLASAEAGTVSRGRTCIASREFDGITAAKWAVTMAKSADEFQEILDNGSPYDKMGLFEIAIHRNDVELSKQICYSLDLGGVVGVLMETQYQKSLDPNEKVRRVLTLNSDLHLTAGFLKQMSEMAGVYDAPLDSDAYNRAKSIYASRESFIFLPNSLLEDRLSRIPFKRKVQKDEKVKILGDETPVEDTDEFYPVDIHLIQYPFSEDFGLAMVVARDKQIPGALVQSNSPINLRKDQVIQDLTELGNRNYLEGVVLRNTGDSGNYQAFKFQ